MQEVLTAVHANVEDFHHQGPNDSFRGWLFRITRNKILDHIRRGRHQAYAKGGTAWQAELQEVPELAKTGATQSSEQSAHNIAVWRTLELIRNDFQQRTFQAFWLVVVEGRPANEVASQLDMTVPAVHQARYRVSQRLREEVGACQVDPKAPA